MDTKEIEIKNEEKEEMISIVGLLSPSELMAIGITKEELEHPTEETFRKIQEYF